MVGRKTLFLLVLLAFLPRVLRSQQSSGLAAAYEFERAGRFQEAADGYRAVLGASPTNVSALHGLERVFTPLGQLDSLKPLIATALTVQPANGDFRAIGLRVLGVTGNVDAINRAGEDWVRVAPGDPQPYRTWARALSAYGDLELARATLQQGADRLGDTPVAHDLIALSAHAAVWVPVARQWSGAVEGNAALTASAISNLSPAPVEVQSWVVDVLGANGGLASARVAAEVLLGWGRPLDAWNVWSMALPREPDVAVAQLRRFADRARLVRSPEATLARGYALEEVARLSTGTARQRATQEAARAFVEAGDQQAADRLLAALSNRPEPQQQGSASAAVTLIGVMAQSGRMDEAEQRFNEWQDRLPAADVRDLRRQLALAWLENKNVERAAGMVGADSSVEILAIKGWISLYQGHLREATAFFRDAGPRVGSRAEATERTSVVALIQQIEPDTLPELGVALLHLRSADTSAAVAGLEAVASSLGFEAGRNQVFAFAGRLAVDAGLYSDAERLLTQARSNEAGGAIAEVLYQLGRTYYAQQRADTAKEVLEELILNHADSALLPLARRLLDRVEGRIPG